MTSSPTIFQKIREAQQRARRGPVDVEALARSLGVKIERPLMHDEMSGALVRKRDGSYAIQVNAAHPTSRQRFTMAHELGHYVYHRSLLGDGVNDSRAYRTTAGAYYNPRIGPHEETQANKFAASLLMPTEAVNEMIARRASVDEMARHFGVSRHAMSIRAGVPYTG